MFSIFFKPRRFRWRLYHSMQNDAPTSGTWLTKPETSKIKGFSKFRFESRNRFFRYGGRWFRWFWIVSGFGFCDFNVSGSPWVVISVISETWDWSRFWFVWFLWFGFEFSCDVAISDLGWILASSWGQVCTNIWKMEGPRRCRKRVQKDECKITQVMQVIVCASRIPTSRFGVGVLGDVVVVVV